MAGPKLRGGARGDVKGDLVRAREAEPEHAAREEPPVPVHKLDGQLRLAETAESRGRDHLAERDRCVAPAQRSRHLEQFVAAATNSGFGASGIREPVGRASRSGKTSVGIEARSVCAAASRAGASGVGANPTSAW